MCGIAGVLGNRPAPVRRMVAMLGHRGPDGSAVAAGGRSTLGCARLAIRGGELGAQPLRTARGLLVFNGEIYNTGELAKELAAHGVEADESSDTRIAGALLDLKGIRAIDQWNGMFALAWDDGEVLWLARDPAGIKPLYYTGDAFASEIRPLLPPGPQTSPDALRRWLTFHVAYGEQTFFEGIRRVPPGGIVALPGPRVTRAGDPALVFSAPNPALDEARLRKVLVRSVRDARPGEPFGVTLSGGIDSTLVAALARDGGGATAYHGRVAEDGCDESPFARAAAAELGLPLVEVPITAEACLDALPKVVRALEEPVAGPGAVAQWLVAERASRDVRILLSGCGGDELFGGYARAAALVRESPPEGLEAHAPLFDRVRGLAPPARAFELLSRREGTLFTREFLDRHPAPRKEFEEAFAAGGLDPLAAAARAEISIILPGLLQVEDRVAMAFGVESRVPLLDRRLLRCAARLAPEARVGADGRPKALFRAAAAPHLPGVVRARRDKMGFPLPLAHWFRGPWRAFARETLLERRTRERGMVDPHRAEAALAAAAPYDRGLYAALLLELWCRAFLDG